MRSAEVQRASLKTCIKLDVIFRHKQSSLFFALLWIMLILRCIYFPPTLGFFLCVAQQKDNVNVFFFLFVILFLMILCTIFYIKRLYVYRFLDVRRVNWSIPVQSFVLMLLCTFPCQCSSWQIKRGRCSTSLTFKTKWSFLFLLHHWWEKRAGCCLYCWVFFF